MLFSSNFSFLIAPCVFVVFVSLSDFSATFDYFLPEESHDATGDTLTLRLSEDVSFLNRASIMQTLDEIPPNTRVVIDASKSVNVDYDVYEIIREFEEKAALNDIDLTVKGLNLRQRNDATKKVFHALDSRKERIGSLER